MSNSNSIVNSFGWAFFEGISQQLTSFIVSTILARIIFPNEFGIIAIVNAFFSVCESLVVNGFATSLIQKKDASEKDFNTIFSFNITVSILISLLLLLISPMIVKTNNSSQILKVLRFMILQIPISAFNSIETTYLYKKMMFKKTFLVTFISSILSGIVGILFALLGYGIWSLVIQKNLLFFISMFFLVFESKWFPKFEFDYSSFKELSSFGIKTATTSFVGTIFNHLKTFVIGIRYSSTDLAFFNKGESFPLLISNNIDSTVAKVLFPILSNVQDDKTTHKKYIKTAISVESFIIFPAMIGLFAVSDNLVVTLLTDKWLLCVPYLKIVCIQQCFSFLNTINLQAYKSVGRADISLKLEIIKKPFLIIIIYLMSRVSTLAIAYGLLIYESIALLINSFPAKRILNYSLNKQLCDLSLSLLSSLMMGFVVIIFNNISNSVVITLTIQILVGLIFYILVSYICNKKTFLFIKKIITEKLHGTND